MLESEIENLKSKIRGGLIVSCQAAPTSPLCRPDFIAALAQTAELNGAVGVRIDSPAHVAAVKLLVKIPIIGISKIVAPDSEVYITPTFASAQKVAASGANVIAVDATLRPRPNDETLAELIWRIHNELKLPVMADVATFSEGVHAAQMLGANFVGTTLAGYTAETTHLKSADFDLVENLAKKISVPIICEGRLKSPADVRRAFDCGAFAVVVGTAITGIDSLTADFVSATPHHASV